MSEAVVSRRDELLDAAVAHVVAHGYAGFSYRTLASALGVAHNSLTHHFGSRSELLAAIYRRMREQAQLALAVDDPGLDPVDLVRAYWQRACTPDHAVLWTSFFEFYAHALRERGTLQDYLTEVTRDWIGPLAARVRAAGATNDAEAEAVATLLTATVRGLLLDRIGAPDPERVDRAFELYLLSLRSRAARSRRRTSPQSGGA